MVVLEDLEVRSRLGKGNRDGGCTIGNIDAKIKQQ